MTDVRIKFTADIVISGEDINDVVKKWLNLPLFSEEAQKCGVEFGEVVLVEDANTYDDISTEFNKSI
jgi:flavin-dependent dehydrogenase